MKLTFDQTSVTAIGVPSKRKSLKSMGNGDYGRVVRNYVPCAPVPPKTCTPYSPNQILVLSKPCTVPCTQTLNHVSSTFESMNFHQKVDKKVK